MSPGDRVRYTGRWLAQTGQMTGSAGQWSAMIVECACGLCDTGRFVALDEPMYDDETRQRHIAKAHVIRIGHVAPYAEVDAATAQTFSKKRRSGKRKSAV